MHRKTIAELAQGLRRREFSSVELTEALLARIRTLDGQLNCFVTVTEDTALAAARDADARLARGRPDR